MARAHRAESKVRLFVWAEIIQKNPSETARTRVRRPSIMTSRT